MNPYEAYRDSGHEATPRRMMPYEMWNGVVRLCGLAKRAVGEGDFAARHRHLVRAQEIVSALDQAFDDRLAPDLAQTAHEAYRRVLRALEVANLASNLNALDQAREAAEQIAQSWHVQGIKAGGGMDASDLG